jgi:hypothetical protein
LPAVTARGRWAGTTDDQRIVIVFGVIVLMVMASSTTRAVLPWRIEIEVIWVIFAITTVYTKTEFGGLSGRFCTRIGLIAAHSCVAACLTRYAPRNFAAR